MTKSQATRLWGWVRHHRMLSFVMLIGLLAQVGFGIFWTVNLVRFGLPPPTGQNCGSLDHQSWKLTSTTRADASLQPLSCFWQAYQTCQSATISQTFAATDAGATDTLTIEWRNFQCAIYGQDELQINTSKSTTTFLCTQLDKEGDDLQVSGCDGIESFALMARYLPDESYPCGVVNSTAPYTYRTPQDMETCFFAAYQHCLADSLAYRTARNEVRTERDFYIDNHCGIAYSRGIVNEYDIVPRQPGAKLASCASLVVRPDGLDFLHCGTDGNVFVPNDPPLTTP